MRNLTDPRVRALSASLLAGGLLTGALVWGVAAPASAVVGDCSSINDTTTQSDPDTDKSQPMTEMGIAAFQRAIERRTGRPAGAGVTVAVVDSGVRQNPAAYSLAAPIPVGDAKSSPMYYHGTAVAGLIAGRPTSRSKPIGVAPGASLVDVHFYDASNEGSSTDESTADDQGAKLDPQTLTLALDRIAQINQQASPADRIDIVNTSVGVVDDPGLRSAVKRLTDQGTIIVASSGNRPAADSGGFPSGYETPHNDEDAATAVYPAGYAVDDPLVVAAGSTYDAGTDSGSPSPVLPNSAITVVAPTANGVSFGINDMTCGLGGDPATSWSAAEVTGILAGLMSAVNETPIELVQRLEATATGGADSSGLPADRFNGQGVVQPLDALTRPLDFNGKGVLVDTSRPQDAVPPAVLPQPPPDVLASTRHHALWWGLAGGGVLLVAVTLRPVLSRRRS